MRCKKGPGLRAPALFLLTDSLRRGIIHFAFTFPVLLPNIRAGKAPLVARRGFYFLLFYGIMLLQNFADRPSETRRVIGYVLFCTVYCRNTRRERDRATGLFFVGAKTKPGQTPRLFTFCAWHAIICTKFFEKSTSDFIEGFCFSGGLYGKRKIPRLDAGGFFF